MDRYEIAVIGTGPAGLEAAVTAKLRNKKILLLGSGLLSPKVEKAHTVKNYLGLPDITGETMQKAFLDHLKSMELAVTEDRANMIYAMGDYFMIQGHKANYEASSVILACGLEAEKPLPGEKENLGHGVSYCATCDAALYRDKSAVVLGYAAEDEKEAEFLAEMAAKVFYLPMYEENTSFGNDGKAIEVITGAKPQQIRKNEDYMSLVLTDRTLEADGIFILRENAAPADLVPGLEMDGNLVAVNRSMQTNIPGFFACGDITGAPYQYIKAAGEGNVAALSAVKYLSEL